MSKRYLAGAAVALTLIVGAASGCSGTSPGATSARTSGASATIPLLRVGVNFSESTLDVTKNTGAYIIDNLALATLLNLGPQAHPEPNLATSVTQPDSVT